MWGWCRSLKAVACRLREERGAVLPFMCVGLVGMMAAIGGAVDVGRIYIVRSQLQAGVDAAALAGARAFGNATATDPNNRDNRVKTYFMGIFGSPPQQITAVARAELQPRPLEVMVVLDSTGSMNDSAGSVGKIQALKNAMHSFLNVLFQGSSARSDLAGLPTTTM